MVLDLDQYILLTIYPTAAIFGLGLLARNAKLSESLKYFSQGSACIIISMIYYEAVPNGGAEGLAIVLLLFGISLLLMARKYIIQPESGHKERTSANKT